MRDCRTKSLCIQLGKMDGPRELFLCLLVFLQLDIREIIICSLYYKKIIYVPWRSFVLLQRSKKIIQVCYKEQTTNPNML